jgi:hypothetical protein
MLIIMILYNLIFYYNLLQLINISHNYKAYRV